MKLLPLILVALVVGTALGTTLAYVAVGPAPEPVAVPVVDDLQGDDLDKLLSERLGNLIPTPAATPRAKLRVDEQEYDFGVMQRGAKQSHEFVIHNDGDAPLRLKVLKTSCKCTVGDAGGGPIPPGESAPVKLEWIARALPGPFRQTASLETNDPLHSPFELSISGEVIDATGLAPQEFSLGRVSTDESREASVVFMSFDREDLELTADPPDAEDNPGAGGESYAVEVTPLAVEDLPDSRAKAGARITLKVKPGLPIGVINGWVTLHTNLPEVEELQVPVFGRVEGDLSIHGARWSEHTGVLAIGIVDAKQGFKSRLRVSIKGEKANDPKLRIIEVDPPELQVSLGEAREVREGVAHVPLTIEVPAGTRPLVRLHTGRKPDGTYQHPEGIVRLATGDAADETGDERSGEDSEIELRVRFAVGG